MKRSQEFHDIEESLLLVVILSVSSLGLEAINWPFDFLHDGLLYTEFFYFILEPFGLFLRLTLNKNLRNRT